MVKIPNLDDYIREYIVLENKSLTDFNSETPKLFYFGEGIRFKITKIDGSFVKYKITSSMKECEEIIEKWAKQLKERAEEDISNLQHALDLWNNSPEKFIPSTKYPFNYNDENGNPRYFKRTDEEKPKYSYQITFECFETKEMYEKAIKKNKLELIRWSGLDDEKRKCLYSIMTQKSSVDIFDLNKISFDFYETKKKVKKPKFPMKLTGEKLNSILGYLDEGIIDDEIIDEIKEKTNIDMSLLKNWEYEYDSEGEMYNDSQILEYTIKFTSPENHEYSAYDSHNAIRGWSFDGKIDFD